MKALVKLSLYIQMFAFVLCSSDLSAQVDTLWTRLYATDQWDEARSVTTDEENNIYVAGWNYQWSVNFDFLFFKYTPQGVLEWSKKLDYSSGDHAEHIAYDGSGNIYVAGFVNGVYSTTGGSLCLMKYSADGDSIWHFIDQNTYTGQVKEMRFDGDGNIILAGFELGGGNSSQYVTMKIDPDGNQLWYQTFSNGGPNDTNKIYGLCVNENNEVIVTGVCDDPVNFYTDIITIKYAPDGETLWVRQFNGPDNYYDGVSSVNCDSEGNFIVAGQVSYEGPAQSDVVILKYNNDGDLIWDKYYDYAPAPQSFDYSVDMEMDEMDNIYVIGSSSYSNVQATNRLLVAKFNSSGDTLWTRRWGAEGDKMPSKLIIGPANNVYVGGTFYNYATTSYDGLVLRYDSNGSLIWEEPYSTDVSGEENFSSIALDENNDLIAVGRQHSPTTFDFLTVKYGNSTVNIETLYTEAQRAVSIYPNPSSSSIILQVECELSGSAMMRVLDMRGHIVMEQLEVFMPGQKRAEINIDALSAGLYEIQVIEDGRIYSGKLIRLE